MKTRFYFWLAFFVFFFISINVFSFQQNPNDPSKSTASAEINDSLIVKIQELQDIVKNDSYTRIPNKDFENILDNKIQKSMREIINWWLIVIAALFSVLGFLANKYAKAYIQTMIDSKVSQLNVENEEKIKSISNHYFSSVIESLLDFKMETITKKNHIVEEKVIIYLLK